MLEVQNLSVSLAGRDVLREVSLTLEAGEVVAVVGPNGAGKSTLLSAMSGSLRPGSGRVVMDGTDISSLKADQLALRRAVLEQTPRRDIPFAADTLINLAIPRQINPAEATKITEQVLNAVGMTELASHSVDRMSGGEAHRTHLARAWAQLMSARLLGHPGYLLVDEPTASLDLVHQSAVCEIARKSAAEGAGVLMIVHDLTLAAAVADRIALLDQGRLVAVGSPSTVLTSEMIARTYKTPVLTHVIDGQLVVLPQHLQRHATQRKLAS
ncbi:MAG: ATP-binding cassette domain-containing protein [Pseudomonadota bacterium]